MSLWNNVAKFGTQSGMCIVEILRHFKSLINRKGIYIRIGHGKNPIKISFSSELHLPQKALNWYFFPGSELQTKTVHGYIVSLRFLQLNFLPKILIYSPFSSTVSTDKPDYLFEVTSLIIQSNPDLKSPAICL